MNSDFVSSPRARPHYNNSHGPRAQSEGMNDKRKKTQERPRSQPIEPSTNIFINYIPPEFTEEDLHRLCSEYGTIICSKIMINLETGQSKCFGFVRFETLDQARAAINGLQGKIIGSKKLLAKFAQSKEKAERESLTIYIKHLPLFITQEDIFHIFSQFGNILQVVKHNIDLKEPQFWRCIVQYEKIEYAAAAIHAMNNKIIAEGTRPIHVRYADESRLSLPLPLITPSNSASFQSNERQYLPSFLFL